MSLETWKAEFYSVSAPECPEEKALQHTLLKWTGLRLENLAKHGVFHHGNYIMDKHSNIFAISTRTCALCCWYYKDGKCKGCPLYCCFRPSETSPYTQYTKNRDPEPMIEKIKGAM